jgi:hypothetical protein
MLTMPVVPAVADVEQRGRATALHTPLHLLILILTAVACVKPCLKDWGWVPMKSLLVFVQTQKQRCLLHVRYSTVVPPQDQMRKVDGKVNDGAEGCCELSSEDCSDGCRLS